MAEFDMSTVTHILTNDGVWHPVAPGTLTITLTPIFVETSTGEQVTPGGNWYSFADATTGDVYAGTLPFPGAMIAAPSGG